MAVQIRFRGLILEVPVSELREVVDQLTASKAPADKPPSVRRMRDEWPMPLAAFSVADSVTEAQLDPADGLMALKLLKEIKDWSDLGMDMRAEQVAALLGVNHPKGIGSRSASINRLLTSAGFVVEEVYVNRRDTAGERHWQPGPNISEAIATLERRFASSQPN